MEIFSEHGHSNISLPASNVLVDGKTDIFNLGTRKGNYWLGVRHQNSEFVIKFGCYVIINGVTIRNSKNFYSTWGTKKFSIYMATNSEGSWVKAMTGTLEDPRPLNPVPIKYFDMIGKGKLLKFKTEEFYGGGPGVQYFDVHSNYFSDITYKASNALEKAKCDHYVFSDEVEGFR